MTAQAQFCTFVVDGYHFGIEVELVQEVLRYQELTRVPLAQPVVSGLINLRGQIVTAVNLRRRLALRERADGRLPMNVILRCDDGPVSLLVDEIGEVLSIDADLAEPPPETLRGAERELVKQVYKLDDRSGAPGRATGRAADSTRPGRTPSTRLLLILDAEKAVRFSAARGAR